MAQDSLQIGDWLLEPRLNRLSRDGRVETLEPLAAEVLAHLAEHAGEVVSADRLTATLWPRRFVGDSPVYRIIADLRRILGDDARAPAYIETIRKRGYRLIAAVEREADITEPAALDGEAASDSGARSVTPGDASVKKAASISRYTQPAAIAAGLAIVATVSWLAMRSAEDPRTAPDTSGSLSVAVLPFLDMSAAQDNEHIGDGIAEALIHQLAQVPDVRVIARNSSFTFKGMHTDVREIGRALNVEAVLEGSIQRERDELRITAQLVDTRTGMHIWSRQFDRDAADIFAVQDEIAFAVFEEVSSASAESAELPRSAEVTDNLDAYDFYLLGRARLRSRATGEARQLFTRAIALDPEFALAHTGLAEALLYDAERNILGLDPDEDVVKLARASIDRALQLDPDQIEALASHVLLAQLDRNWAALEEAFARAVERGPGYALTYYYYADALSAWAIESFDRPRFDQALRYYSRARSLDPLNPLIATSLATYFRRVGERAEATAEAHKVYDLATNDDDLVLALDLLSQTAYEFGQLDRAIALAHLEASVRGGFSPSGANRVAMSYFHLSEFDRASTWFDESADDTDDQYLFAKALLAYQLGDTAQFEAIVNELLNDPPQGMSPELALADAIMSLGQAGQCERVVAASDRMTDSPFRAMQPAPDIYVAGCHLKLATGDARPYEERLRRYVGNQEAFGDKTRVGLWLQASIASVLRDRDKALALADAAVEVGMHGSWWFADDVIFEWIATDERFLRLVDKVERNNAAMLERLYGAETSGDWCELAQLAPRGALISAGACTAG